MAVVKKHEASNHGGADRGADGGADGGVGGGGGGEAEAEDLALRSSGVLGGLTEGDEIRTLLLSLQEVHGDPVASEVTTERFLGERPPDPPPHPTSSPTT